MSFSNRNSFYLRISRTTVLPIYIYLDERHVKWMSDIVLQHVLSDLRPHILSKLKAETNQLTGVALNGKKATVDTHRGDTYQFCYFIRKTEQHSVAIKSRNFRAIPQEELKRYIPKSKDPSSKSRGKRKEVTSDDGALPTTAAKRKKRKTQNKAAAQSKPTNADVVDVDMDDLSANDEEQLQTGVDSGAAQMDATTPIDLEVDSEEEKPKPILNLTYQGFNIYGHCLCVVVEPWPVIRSMTTSLSNRSVAGSSLFQQQTSKPSDERSPPLFLPEELQENEISDGDSDSDAVGGMMQFSQVLRSVGDSRAGAANDDEGMDGSVLFGDADEFKEL